MKCARCNTKVRIWDAYGNPFSSKFFCHDCWWKINGFDRFTFMDLDEIRNELRKLSKKQEAEK